MLAALKVGFYSKTVVLGFLLQRHKTIFWITEGMRNESGFRHPRDES
jgi:hypothetical protein